jgi:hypothetical protein
MSHVLSNSPRLANLTFLFRGFSHPFRQDKHFSNRLRDMIGDTIEKIEARIRTASSIKAANKTELLALLGTLKSEITELSKIDADHAQSIASFAGVSTHEATRDVKNPELLKLAIDGLTTSVEGFEASHPKLVHIVNSICRTLANLGI